MQPSPEAGRRNRMVQDLLREAAALKTKQTTAAEKTPSNYRLQPIDIRSSLSFPFPQSRKHSFLFKHSGRPPSPQDRAFVHGASRMRENETGSPRPRILAAANKRRKISADIKQGSYEGDSKTKAPSLLPLVRGRSPFEVSFSGVTGLMQQRYEE